MRTATSHPRRLVDPAYLELLADLYASKQRRLETANPTIILIGLLDEVRALRAALESQAPAPRRRQR